VERPSWVPEDVDVERPSIARVYDYYLGGSHNFAADREFADQVLRVMPEATTAAQQNRAFLRRAVRYLCAAGIRQFIDLGSGIPTVGNVHEVAQAAAPDARVVYVDLDPVAYAHSRAILADHPHATVIRADLRKPGDVLADRQLCDHIDFDRPVGILLVAVLHFVPDGERPADIVASYSAATAPGSHVVVSHATDEGMTKAGAEVVSLYNRSSRTVVTRSTAQLTTWMDGLSLVDPGVVNIADWRPDSPEDAAGTRIPGLAMVAKRP
jgi:S-adenosyl methyltransferase